VLVSSSLRYALMHELRGAPELTLDQAIARLGPCDVVLVEGYKVAPIPKLEVWREHVGKPLLHEADPHIVGIASDDPDRFGGGLPAFRLGDVAGIATFVLAQATLYRTSD
jgi:molybdopterin-guanine dinucleotide biosynthesis adapter protein